MLEARQGLGAFPAAPSVAVIEESSREKYRRSTVGTVLDGNNYKAIERF